MSFSKEEISSNNFSWSNFLNWGTVYRGYNAGVALLVTYQYLTNPEASFIEHIPDILIHAAEAVIPNQWSQIAIVANVGRASQAAYGFFSGNSTIPSVANLVDVGNHLLNTAHRLS
ncbi:TPA: hypothetical protein ACPSKY_001015 [Legionella bozemanae]|uniref:Uncharacterized protein n=1 Tax=Legionella bozemanae TaxID=447 RepID=A0A0W0RJU3_LEGBO|nr:hypothetical protein [Legionella bozemanae]KTC71340.1 hypothetical protein Lboz_2917 [Legionella bozemanae]STO35434.1 Uncharacterised protein [Legionella bozemanae]